MDLHQENIKLQRINESLHKTIDVLDESITTLHKVIHRKDIYIADLQSKKTQLIQRIDYPLIEKYETKNNAEGYTNIQVKLKRYTQPDLEFNTKIDDTACWCDINRAKRLRIENMIKQLGEIYLTKGYEYYSTNNE